MTPHIESINLARLNNLRMTLSLSGFSKLLQLETEIRNSPIVNVPAQRRTGHSSRPFLKF
jgi:hypothetical protein